MDEFEEILEDFLIEAFEMIEQLDNDLIELESTPEDLDLLNRIFRVAHTIKGSSSFLNFDILTHLTHHMEDVLNKARRGELVITPDVMDVVLESTDKMKALLEHIKETGNDKGAFDVGPTVKRLEEVLKVKGGEAEAPAVEVEPEPEMEEPDLSEMSEEEIDAEIERLLKERQEEDRKKREAKKRTEAGEEKSVETAGKEVSEMSEEEVEAEIERLLKERQEEDRKRREAKKKAQQKDEAAPKEESVSKPAAAPKQKPEAKPASAKERKATMEQTIRVDVKRLDDLMNLIGELVLGKNRLLKIYDDVEERYEGEQFLEELNQVVSSVSLVTTDLQIAVMKTRMLPIGKVFNKFPRMVRDILKQEGKEAQLVIEGSEVELDRTALEALNDALAILLFIVVRAGIFVFHTVAQSVVE